MIEPRPIHSEADYELALTELARLWTAESAEDGRRLADWGELIDLYEARLIQPPRNLDPVAVIKAEMEMNGRSRADLAAIVGQNRATEILKRKRPLTLPMIRALHAQWGIPSDLLIAEYETA
jgi:HTH-type transcriptional regulator/antitoxin HigA